VAAEEIAEDLVEGRVKDAVSELRTVATTAPPRPRTRQSGGLLAAKAATEYVYVAQDLRRIVVIASLLFAVMLALWVLIEVVRIRF
jgi:hypothetical protein